MGKIETLYREALPQLLGYFRSKGARVCDAEDLAQSTFERALRKPTRIEAALSPRAFLFGIARHVWLDAARRLKPVEEGLSDNITEAAAPVDPRLADVRSAIDALSPLYREPLMLKLQLGLSYTEIADILELPIGTVRSRLHNAVRQLRTNINADQQ